MDSGFRISIRECVVPSTDCRSWTSRVKSVIQDFLDKGFTEAEMDAVKNPTVEILEPWVA